MKNILLRVEKLSKAYTPGVPVWNEITFDLVRGEFLYILGGSGAGKSSLLRSIASFEDPTSGVVECFGVSYQKAEPETLQTVRKRISYIPQHLGLMMDLTLEDHVRIAQKFVPQSDRISEEQLKQYLQWMGLSKYWNRKISELSGGERQRVAILRALSKKTDLLIADEPTGAQDFEMTWKLMDLFVKLNLQGTSILLATHDLEMVRRLRKRCGILKDGTLKVEDRTS